MSKESRSNPEEALGRSDVFLAFQHRLSRVAKVERPVLIIGERGTGKELAAKRIHYLSNRWNEPLVTLNCAALSPTLIATELFGHEAGAYTGAVRRQTGRFETADKGTLFLDEIGAIPMEAQEKILRVVEYGFFERVGSSHPIQVDARIIAATHADLPALVKHGHFKPDLLDRLSFDVLFLPPLRQRKEDIMLLANHFAARMAFELGKSEIPQFDLQATQSLESYNWPGNIRELKNVVERAVYQSQNDTIDTVEFDPFQSPFRPSTPLDPGISKQPERIDPRGGFTDFSLPLLEAVRLLEIDMLSKALEEARFNQKKAADILGLSYHQFRGLYRKHADSLQDQ